MGHRGLRKIKAGQGGNPRGKPHRTIEADAKRCGEEKFLSRWNIWIRDGVEGEEKKGDNEGQ